MMFGIILVLKNKFCFKLNAYMNYIVFALHKWRPDIAYIQKTFHLN